MAVLASLLPLVTASLCGAIQLGELLIGERTIELRPQRIECIRAGGAASAAHDNEPQRSIERGQLLFAQRPSELFGERQPRHGAYVVSLLDFVSNWNLTTADLDEVRKR